MDLEHLIGLRYGPGQGLTITAERVAAFDEAIETKSAMVPPMLLVSLLAALGGELPVPTPRAMINYGLNGFRPLADVAVGDTVSAIFTIVSVEPVGSAFQLERMAEVLRGEQVVLRAETLTRLVY